jgi:hypothetical protein
MEGNNLICSFCQLYDNISEQTNNDFTLIPHLYCYCLQCGILMKPDWYIKLQKELHLKRLERASLPIGIINTVTS